jgi:hypothetical protein
MIKRIACFGFIGVLLIWFGIKQFSALVAGAEGLNATSPAFGAANAQDAGTSNTKAEQTQAIAELKRHLAGHEDEPAEKFFRNIDILKGKKASRLPGLMSALTGLLGVDCSYCHVKNEWDREDKPAKQTARKMFRMIEVINKDNFEGKNAVSCWTCHRGNPHPPIQAQAGK